MYFIVFVVIQDGNTNVIYNNWWNFDLIFNIYGIQFLGVGKKQTNERMSKAKRPGQPEGVWRRSPHVCGRVPSISPSLLKDIIDGGSSLDCLLARLDCAKITADVDGSALGLDLGDHFWTGFEANQPVVGVIRWNGASEPDLTPKMLRPTIKAGDS